MRVVLRSNNADIFIFFNFTKLGWRRWFKFFPMEDRDQFILQNQYVAANDLVAQGANVLSWEISATIAYLIIYSAASAYLIIYSGVFPSGIIYEQNMYVNMYESICVCSKWPVTGRLQNVCGYNLNHKIDGHLAGLVLNIIQRLVN